MIILITGANGSLGYEIVNKLKTNNSLYLFDRNLDKFSSEKNLVLIEGDITDLRVLNSLKQKVDCIIHLAAKVHVKPKNDEERNDFYQVNFIATKNLYHWALENEVKHFIFMSTLSVYGEKTSTIVDESSECFPITDYAKSKFQAEIYGLDLHKSYNLPITIFRLATLYGTYDRGNYGKLISAVERGVVPRIGKGLNRKPIAFVKDAANIIIQSICNEKLYGGTYIISEGNYTYSGIINTIKKIFNIKSKIIIIPYFIISVLKALNINKGIFGQLITLNSDFRVDNNKLINEIGYTYKYNFEQGLRDSYNYYSSRKGD